MERAIPIGAWGFRQPPTIAAPPTTTAFAARRRVALPWPRWYDEQNAHHRPDGSGDERDERGRAAGRLRRRRGGGWCRRARARGPPSRRRRVRANGRRGEGGRGGG